MEAARWPVPPPFMWRCVQCTGLLEGIATRTCGEFGSFYEQLMLAKHIVRDHPEDVPGPHGASCTLCTHYAKHGDVDLWEEHRSRGLFMPPSVAGLM